MKTVALVLSFLFLLTACSAPATSPAPTSTISIVTPFSTTPPPSPIPATEAAPTASPQTAVEQYFGGNAAFVAEMEKQDAQVASHISVTDGTARLTTEDGTQHEIGPAGTVNKDIFGAELSAINTGFYDAKTQEYRPPLLVAGKAGTEDAGKLFSYNTDTDSWFEVVQPTHIVDKTADEATQRLQRLEAMGDQTPITLAYLQNGDLWRAVVLSGQLTDFSDKTFTGNSLYHNDSEPAQDNANVTELYTSLPKIPAPLYYEMVIPGTYTKDGKEMKVGIEPFEVWNPSKPTTADGKVNPHPNPKETLVAFVPRGPGRMGGPLDSLWDMAVFGTTINDKAYPALDPLLFVSDSRDTSPAVQGLAPEDISWIRMIPGNDPSKFPFVTVNVDANKNSSVWQTGPIPIDVRWGDVQKIIWKAEFTQW